MSNIPLPELLRPKTLKDFVGQENLVGPAGIIRKLLDNSKTDNFFPSLIFWGPPGTGKTTLARIIANTLKREFFEFSAVNTKVKDIEALISDQKQLKLINSPIIFLDEIHRFNKAQQDAFLPFVENGTITLVGATTENPSFEVIAPLLSRCRVFKLNSLTEDEIKAIVKRAVSLYPKNIWEKPATDMIMRYANGDARAAINAVELAANLAKTVNLKVAEEALQKKALYYDKKGESHFDTISAFIKSMRGSDVNATLHYLARMIKAGEEAPFIARRMVIFASEDIGNARPNALVLAVTCMQAVNMIGMPESSLILAQTATYLASCPKSIASTLGIQQALSDIEEGTLDPIPLHLRNPTTKLMAGFGYGKGHTRYPWKVERETGKKIKQQYLPDNLKDKKYYVIDF